MKIASALEFQEAKRRRLPVETHCKNCSMPFSPSCVYSEEGWLRTQEERICEDCYEDIKENMPEAL